mmetsp:Transcript_77847/g.220691  ORF Transcript_77847/g.220691 Transcript_77847/m.220691 type:complete len:242 (+) Transcript_77847:242-967(+)
MLSFFPGMCLNGYGRFLCRLVHPRLLQDPLAQHLPVCRRPVVHPALAARELEEDGAAVVESLHLAHPELLARVKPGPRPCPCDVWRLEDRHLAEGRLVLPGLVHLREELVAHLVARFAVQHPPPAVLELQEPHARSFNFVLQRHVFRSNGREAFKHHRQPLRNGREYLARLHFMACFRCIEAGRLETDDSPVIRRLEDELRWFHGFLRLLILILSLCRARRFPTAHTEYAQDKEDDQEQEE